MPILPTIKEQATLFIAAANSALSQYTRGRVFGSVQRLNSW